MKKFFSIACLAIVVAALSSCTKKYVTNVIPNQTWISNHQIVTSDWAQTADGKSDSVDVAIPKGYQFFNDSDATLVYFSFNPNVYEQVPEVYNGIAYSYFHYTTGKDNGLHVVLYSQPVSGGTPVKPTSPITLKLVLIPSEIQQ